MVTSGIHMVTSGIHVGDFAGQAAAPRGGLYTPTHVFNGG